MANNIQSHTSKRFKPAIGVTSARLLSCKPAFITRGKSHGRYAVGIRYEAQVQEHLELLALGNSDLDYVQGPWIEYCDDNGRRYCQPDALLVDRRNLGIIIVEVKYQHTMDAWWQLVHLYRPVVSVLYPQYSPVGLLEIVHWHDPQIKFPERYDFTDSPLRIPHANKVAVHIFNQRRKHGTKLASRRSGPTNEGHEPGKERK